VNSVFSKNIYKKKFIILKILKARVSAIKIFKIGMVWEFDESQNESDTSKLTRMTLAIYVVDINHKTMRLRSHSKKQTHLLMMQKIYKIK
jgi:hypothetical protein